MTIEELKELHDDYLDRWTIDNDYSGMDMNVHNDRPHSALGYLPPTVFLQKYGRLVNFPTLQKDNSINYKNLITNVAS